jgi:hypothetical protein
MRRIRQAVAGLAMVLTLQAGTASAEVMHPSCQVAFAGAASVGPQGPMQFRRAAQGKLKVLIGEGTISTATPQALQKALTGKTRIDEIWLRSSGGDAASGNRAADVVRKSGIPVRIPAGWWCISACNFMFFGGTIRMIDPGGVFGVHMATSVNNQRYQQRITDLSNRADTADILGEIAAREQSMARLTAEDIDIVLRMGVSRRLLSEVMYAQRADEFRDENRDGKPDIGEVPTFRCLTQQEMRRYNVTNVD